MTQKSFHTPDYLPQNNGKDSEVFLTGDVTSWTRCLSVQQAG
jgi:hypothetical protein